MKVGIDVTELAPGAPGGVRRATWLLLDALQKHAPEIELEALAPVPVEVPPGVRLTVTGGPAKPRRWRKSRALMAALRWLDLFHSPVTAIPLDGPPRTATIHELPFMAESFKRVLAQGAWVTRALGHCRAIVVPSHATLRQLCEIHASAPRITHVVPHPAPPVSFAAPQQHDGSLLFVGRLDKRKRAELLLEAGVPIKFAGHHKKSMMERMRRAARKRGAEDKLTFLGVVDERELDELYRQAAAVALVSVSEGFGFPVLEALARGIPVITAAGTGASEVAGDVAIVAEAREMPGAFARALTEEHRAFVRRHGPARALEFSPERTARGYVEVFRRALDG